MCKEAGFDGIIIDASDSFVNKIPGWVRTINAMRGKGMKGVDGANHYVVWESDQIRSSLSEKN